MSSVQVLCPNGRRVNIKVSPNTPLLSVLVDACQRQGLDPRQHALKHQRKILDVSQMFRYSGLPNNAKLEVVTSSHHPRKEQPVRVAVQLQSGDRLQGVFPPAVSLWDLMCSLHGNDQWIVGEAVVVYMRREVCGEDNFKSTSLQDLGVDYGSVVLRLIHRQQWDSNQLPMDTSDDISLSSSADDDMIVEHSDSQDKVGSGPPTSHDPVISGSHDPGSHDTNTVISATHKITRDPVVTGSHDTSHATVSCDSVTSGSHDSVTVVTGSHNPATISSHATVSDSVTSGSHDIVVTGSHDPATISSHTIVSCDSGSHDTAAKDPVATSSTASSHDPITSGSQSVKGSHDFSSTGVFLKDAHDETSATQDHGSCDRQVVVFNMANHSSDVTPTAELPDSFFDVTVDDCVAMQRDLHQKVKKLSDAPLITASLRQASLHERYSQYNKAIIRVQFPDHWVLQGSFQPHESLRALVKFVREHLADPTVKFHLYTTPPKTILTNPRLTLVQAGLVPASIVHFGLHDRSKGTRDVDFLKTSLLEQAISPLQADVIAMATRDNPLCNNESPMETSSSSTVQTEEKTTHTTHNASMIHQDREKSSVNKTKAVPKWFKHSGGKKL